MTVTIVRVGDSHYGRLLPGLLIVIESDKVHARNGITFFENPEGGWTPGVIVEPEELGLCRVTS